MKLLEIEIRNLKSITKAKFRFPAKAGCQVSLLYGDNGAGKTTVLEAISLLGHLSTMRRICANPHAGAVDVRQSRFREFKDEQQTRKPDPETALRTRSHEQYKCDSFREQCELIKQLGIDEWWATTFVSGETSYPARLKYCVQFKQKPVTFYISFLQDRDLSITEALSRDQNGPGETIHDGNMDNWFAVVYSLAARADVEALIEHMRRVSPHSYWNARDEYKIDPRITMRPESKEIVAYWNTDLNDFGRKNDLRESVKKIRIDFRSQMITRLGLALPVGPAEQQRYYEMTEDEPTTADKLEVVNESLKKALIDHSVAMQRERKKLREGLVRLSEIDAHENPATMRARRAGETEDIEIDHLSAGENESVFIFLLMHGMPCRDSIILLDEPDLHLTDFARPRFYTELYRIAGALGCQLIISTHSAVAYTESRESSKHFIRKVVVDGTDGIPTLIYRTDWTDDFGELLTFYYARCAVNAMSQAGLAWKILSWPIRGSIWIGELIGLHAWSVFTFFVAFLGVYSLAATSNDLLLFFVEPSPEFHRLVIKCAFAGCSVTCVLFIMVRFVQRAVRKR